MVKQVRTAYRRRHWMQQAKHVIKQNHGVAARAWPVAPPAHVSLDVIAADARPWLAEQVTRTTTPYSVGQMWVMVALRNEATKQAVWSVNLPAFVRRDAQQALDQAVAAIAAVPLGEHPLATRLEVYLVSLGDIVNAMIDAAGPRA